MTVGVASRANHATIASAGNSEAIDTSAVTAASPAMS